MVRIDMEQVTEASMLGEESKSSMMKSIIEYPVDHPFPIENLPYGCFYTDRDPTSQRCGVAVGDYILDLEALSYTEFFPSCVERDVFSEGTLNRFMSLDREVWLSFRTHLQLLLSQGSPIQISTTVSDCNVITGTEGKSRIGRRLFVDRLAESTIMCLPCKIGDYTDFYSSLEHAYNCGVLIRGKQKALQPNWKHLPVAYHGRASSIVVSGTPIHRPVGQILEKPNDLQPVIKPCKKLDFELEVGFFYGGKPNKLGQRLSPTQAGDHVFGAVLLNDWSARDIQTWEYVPLGPFLSKNFATTISPWIVSVFALQEFTCPGYEHDPPLLAYLEDGENTNFDIPLTVDIRPVESANFTTISRTSLCHTYYTIRQMMAHHTTTGCPLQPGDLLGTGTLSAPGTQGYGSLLEKSHLGHQPFFIETEQGGRVERRFLQDGDTIRMTAQAISKSGEYTIGFGECLGTILPAIPV